MSKPRQTKSGTWELCIQHKLLDKRVYINFDTEHEATAYHDDAMRWLNAGVVPVSLVPPADGPQKALHITVIIQRWRNAGTLSKTDSELLGPMMQTKALTGLLVSGLTYPWVEAWVRGMKFEFNLAPSTIRQRVQALSRCIDWYIRSVEAIANPIKLLPRGYSVYSAQEGAELRKQGKEPKIDIVRERRLQDGEQERILAALGGEKRPDRERGLGDPDLRMLFLLILHTGVRLREAYTLRGENCKGRVLRIQTTKQRNGKIVYRDVPVRPELGAELGPYLHDKTGLVFPFWGGTPDDLERATARLSSRFGNVFAYAECEALTEHDLRHEATCRWFEARTAEGGWMFRSAEIHRIMGWAPNSPMAARYASFRVESLADRMY